MDEPLGFEQIFHRKWTGVSWPWLLVLMMDVIGQMQSLAHRLDLGALRSRRFIATMSYVYLKNCLRNVTSKLVNFNSVKIHRRWHRGQVLGFAQGKALLAAVHQVDCKWCSSGVSGLPLLVSLESPVVRMDLYGEKDGKYGLRSHIQLCVCGATVKGQKKFCT